MRPIGVQKRGEQDAAQAQGVAGVDAPIPQIEVQKILNNMDNPDTRRENKWKF